MPGFWKVVFNNYNVKEGIRKKGTSEATGTPVGRDVPCNHWVLDRVRGGGDRGLGGSVAGENNAVYDVFKTWRCHHLVVKWGCYLLLLFFVLFFFSLSLPRSHAESTWDFSSSQNLWVFSGIPVHASLPPTPCCFSSWKQSDPNSSRMTHLAAHLGESAKLAATLALCAPL